MWISSLRARLLLLGVTAVLMAGVVIFFAPIHQSRDFYQYVDERTWLGLTNFANVATNLPFLLVGLVGLARLGRQSAVPGVLSPGTDLLYGAFYTGLITTFIGSSYYHLLPGPWTLMIDRLAICICFIAFYCIVLSDYLSATLGRRLFLPLLGYSFGAVSYWYTSALETGHGDLSAYLLVQLLPIVHLPIILWLFQPASTASAPRHHYLFALLAYLLAAWADARDSELFLLTGGFISGHSIKHLLAGAGGYLIYRSRVRRIQKQG